MRLQRRDRGGNSVPTETSAPCLRPLGAHDAATDGGRMLCGWMIRLERQCLRDVKARRDVTYLGDGLKWTDVSSPAGHDPYGARTGRISGDARLRGQSPVSCSQEQSSGLANIKFQPLACAPNHVELRHGCRVEVPPVEGCLPCLRWWLRRDSRRWILQPGCKNVCRHIGERARVGSYTR